MHQRIVECAANFSEGRDAAVLDAIAETIERCPGAALLHRTMDPDHNRSVLTFAGSPEGVVAAAVRAVSAAVTHIDLTRHTGVHPRIGAADVVPFIPVENITLAECAGLAREAGQQIWDTARVPVYFYEAASLRPGRTRLEQVRRGQFESLRVEAVRDPDRRPDIGGPELHPTAGAVAVGARKVLVAFNVNLATEDLAVAQGIATKIRTSSGGFPFVKALGLPLASRGQVQVSMNLTDHEQTPVHVVYEAIRREAAHAGVDVASSEIIGLVPRAVLERAAESAMRIENLHPSTVLETRIAEALPRGLLSELESPGGGGIASARAGAMAASLGALVCRRVGVEAAVYEEHREFFTAAAQAGAPGVEMALLVAERALALSRSLSGLSALCPPLFAADASAAAALAAAARQGAVAACLANLVSTTDRQAREEFERRLERVK